jgi:hypothetical protein
MHVFLFNWFPWLNYSLSLLHMNVCFQRGKKRLCFYSWTYKNECPKLLPTSFVFFGTICFPTYNSPIEEKNHHSMASCLFMSQRTSKKNDYVFEHMYKSIIDTLDINTYAVREKKYNDERCCCLSASCCCYIRWWYE